MFTIYNPRTREVRTTITARTREIAYEKADRICNRIGGGTTLMFDDTCDHGTAFELCQSTECQDPA